MKSIFIKTERNYSLILSYQSTAWERYVGQCILSSSINNTGKWQLKQEKFQRCHSIAYAF